MIFIIARYLENNARRFTQYRLYNADVPAYLHNRPSSLVSHCMEKLVSIASVGQEAIRIKDMKQGVFEVESQEPNMKGHWYAVSFGDENAMPNCECADWQKNRLPCKHFLLIFNHIEGWDFEKLPTHYNESPFLSLDHEVVFLKQPVQIEHNESSDSIAEQANNIPTSITVPTSQITVDIPDRQKHTRRLSTKCKEKAKQLTSLLHVTDDDETLKKVELLLDDCIDLLNKSVEHDDGIVLITQRKSDSMKQKFQLPSKSEVTFSNIPKARPKKHPYSGRHGSKAEVMKKSFNIDLDLETGQPAIKRSKSLDVTDVETEIITMDLDANGNVLDNDDDIVDFDYDDITNQRKPAYQDNDEVVENSRKHIHQDNDDYDDITLTSKPTKHNKRSDDDIKITGHCKRPAHLQNKRPTLVLSSQERLKISTPGAMITDESINIAQNLLSSQFPQLKGLENSTLGPINGFSVFRDQFIQVLHTGSAHWICTSNMNCPKNTISYYDSLCTGRPALAIKQQIAQFMHSSDPNITINIIPVQQQKSRTNNCGLFALAYATSLAFGEDPASILYDEQSLRKHLLGCIDNNSMTPFPKLVKPKKPSSRCKKSLVRVEIHCSCRMPWDDRKMAECESCLQWFHQDCEKIDDSVFVNGQEWVCSLCSCKP